MSKATPGPWHLDNECVNAIEIHDSEGRKVAEIISNHDDYISDEFRANAQLIVEAPTTAAERDKLKKRVDVLAQDCTYLELERDKLKEEVEELDAQIGIEIQSHKTLRDEYSKLKEENERLTSQIKIEIHANETIRKEHAQTREINNSLVEALKDCIKSDQVEGFIIDEVRLRSIDLINQSKNS